ncbi:hypothetical protein QZH41_012521 [Actinostola sp. cb2023]|nr:hypothetical protein QZH41_012521 [Actinostola sp. cb2023]
MTSFTFGAPKAGTSAFGTTTTTNPFTFGTPSTSSTAGTTGLFGATAPTASTGAFAFGAGLGAASAFGAKTTAPSTFGTGGSFGSFGSSFGTGLGTTGGTTLGFGQPATQLALPQATSAAISPMVLINLALANPQIYGDERDGIIAKLNHLQAYWGTGKGYYNQQGSAVDFTRENPYCRFKDTVDYQQLVVGYSRLPTASNDDGFVGIQIKKKESEVHQQQQNLVSELQKCFGNKPTIMVCVDGLKPLPDDSTEVVFKVVERADNGMTKTFPANDIYTYLNQPNVKILLQNLGVTNITAKTNMSPVLLQQYLNTPPAGTV